MLNPLDVVDVGFGESKQKGSLSLPGGLGIWRGEPALLKGGRLVVRFLWLKVFVRCIFEGALLNRQRTYIAEKELNTRRDSFTSFC